MYGNNVSHSNRKTRRRFEPNLQRKRFFIPELDKWVTLRISMHALRTINKKGIHAYLTELKQAGVDIGVEI
jgi:large subunit ribosomal protein L28